jgi:hypothetical protein
VNKYMLGERVGNGIVPMNTGRPRPTIEGAFGERTDGPYDYFSVGELTRLSATVRVAGGLATVAMQATNLQDPQAGLWNTLDSAIALDGTVIAVSDLLVAEGSFRYLRFEVSAVLPAGTSVQVEFNGT